MIAIGLGSNLGNPVRNLQRAVAALRAVRDGVNGPMVGDLKPSPVYRSDALLPPGAPSSWDRPFANMVVIGESRWSPQQALAVILRIEQELGRGAHEVWSPRMIDLDILLWNDLDIDTANLRLPHPRIAERPFVVLPLCDVLGLRAASVRVPNQTGDHLISLTQCAELLAMRDDPLHTHRVGPRAGEHELRDTDLRRPG